MGILDRSASHLEGRLIRVGVPAAIAYAIGQVCYVRSSEQSIYIPPAALNRYEATGVVEGYIKEFAKTTDPLACMALVQGMCTRIFESHSEEVFVAGYPEWSAGAFERRAAAALEAQAEAEQKAEAIFFGASRYFQSGPASGTTDFAILRSTLVAGGGTAAERRWEGFVMISGAEIGFLDEEDALARDTAEGTPRINAMGDLEACRIRTPSWVYLPKNLRHVRTGNASENVLINLKFSADEWVLAAWMEDWLMSDSLDSAQEAFQHFVRTCDRAMSKRQQYLG